MILFLVGWFFFKNLSKEKDTGVLLFGGYLYSMGTYTPEFTVFLLALVTVVGRSSLLFPSSLIYKIL